jgi:gas vesicle protein
MADHDDGERGVMISVLAGIGIGVLVGAIAGLLLAPKPGSETRENIGHTLSDLGTKIGDLSQQVATRVRSVVDHSKQLAQETIEKAAEEGGNA